MNYPIEVLRRQITKHTNELVFSNLTDNEIINHTDCIKQLEIAIEKLLLY